jgi:predicted alpha/beta superfamily hydrolase
VTDEGQKDALGLWVSAENLMPTLTALLTLLLTFQCIFFLSGSYKPYPCNSRSPITGDIRFHQLYSKVFQNTRTIRVLLPPAYDIAENKNKRYPVLYLNDGQNLFDAKTSTFNQMEWGVDEAVNDLTIRGKVSPMIVVGVDNAGRKQRSKEYLPYQDEFLQPPEPSPEGKKYPDFLIGEVMPFINERYRTEVGPENTGLGGSSYGAAVALYTAIMRPGIFGRLLLESPSIYISDEQLIKDSNKVKLWPRKVYLAIGTKETGEDLGDREAVGLIRKLETIMRRAGLRKERLLVVIDEGGIHREDAWARRLPSALGFLFER